MSRAVLLCLALLALLPATAAAYPEVGFGEQRSGMFTDPHWLSLGLEDVRVVAGWDATSTRWQRDELDHYLSAAHAAGARVLVAFGRSRVPKRNRMVPSVRRYRAEFRRFRRRYPQVRSFVVWNEANHCSQPVCHRPHMVARYYNMMRSVCGKCTLVGADVLDTPDMEWWLRGFKRRAKSGRKIWGLHNYLDANRFRTEGTRRMLRAVKGPVWFTETGGLVRRSNRSPHKFPDSTAHAARATRWLFRRLAVLSPRVDRIYLYHWSHPGRAATWDSALMTARGRPRPAFKVLVRELGRRR